MEMVSTGQTGKTAATQGFSPFDSQALLNRDIG
jgi:hypothetical protein